MWRSYVTCQAGRQVVVRWVTVPPEITEGAWSTFHLTEDHDRDISLSSDYTPYNYIYSLFLSFIYTSMVIEPESSDHRGVSFDYYIIYWLYSIFIIYIYYFLSTYSLPYRTPLGELSPVI